MACAAWTELPNVRLENKMSRGDEKREGLLPPP